MPDIENLVQDIQKALFDALRPMTPKASRAPCRPAPIRMPVIAMGFRP